MQSIRVTGQADGIFDIAPLPLPTIQRKGVASADAYRRQAAGEPAGIDFNPNLSDAVRAIVLSDGKFEGLASHPGSLLTFVISGAVTLEASPSKTVTLVPGDILLTDEHSARTVSIAVRNQCRLMQIGVPAEWPGPNAKIRQPGSDNPRASAAPKIKRIYKGADDKAYFNDFTELFPKTPDRWSDPHPLTGFRILYWEKGSMDFHPCVTNQLAIVLAGGMEMHVGGGGGAREAFGPGDVCLAEDRTGEGHRNVVHENLFVTVMVVETEHLW
jgi:hypothetical protein